MTPAEALLAELLSGAAQFALGLDDESRNRLEALEGQSLRIHCTAPPQRVTLRVSGGELEVLPGSENPTDATVKGSFSDLVALLRGGTPTHKLAVSGNPAVLRDFARCFEGYEPRMPSALDPLLGPLKDLTGGAGSRSPGNLEDPARAFAEQARGLLEVGFASFKNVLEAGLRQPPPARSEPDPAAAIRQRSQSLRSALANLSARVDRLEGNGRQEDA